MENNSKQSIRDEIVDVITEDKAFTKKLVDRMFWLLTFCGVAVTITFCLVFYHEAGIILQSVLNFFK